MESGLISIDRWGKGSQAYFLTHLHADHTRGLSATWARGPLFCSPLTARLLPARFPGFDSALLRPLHVGSTHTLSLSSSVSGARIHFHVTPIDAHHCPGAVMYLFRGEFGCILHTGDFRWELRSERAQLGKKMLLNALGGDKVDVLYLDNTYCHPSFSFPSRDVAAQQVVDIITLHPNHEVIIGVDTLGKEDLLLRISEALNTKIWVWPERLQTMHLLGYDDIFTTKTCLTRVRAVPRYSLTFDTLEALNTVHPTIGIMPSGLPWGVKPFKENDGSLVSSLAESYKSKDGANSRIQVDRDQTYPVKQFHQFAYSVSYSEHSCYNELEEFVRIVQPSNVTGIVASSFCYINPRHYFGHLCGVSQCSDIPLDNSGGETAEKGDVKQSKFFLAYKKSNKLRVKNERTFRAHDSSMRRSRVCILRRERHGTKIAETEGTCGSDLNAGIM